MSDSHELFLECYNETKIRFPGSTPHILKELASRLWCSVSDESCRTMSHDEVRLRHMNLKTALQTVPQWPGLQPGERPANAKEI